ncbi:uncharacterized protein LOC128863179 [Anastrepha ludens]|uniref:uncharacterized protein LOC128863179 n=1 Tax=Anastrepha ludens TaxID=28586 RepID=UPI0023AF06AD|nr:uncharacterized protein LOC128863179 [Anastrepha ludens]
MFTKMQKFCILAFLIAPVLVFADANGFVESESLHATGPTTTPAMVGATMSVAAQAMEDMRQSVEAKTAQQRMVAAAAVTQTLAATTTATIATTVTLASSNAPATLTTTNDEDELVLSTATPTIAAAALVATDEQAKQQQIQKKQRHQQAQKGGGIVAKKQVVPFIANNATEEPTTTMPTKINAAVVEKGAIPRTPATSTASATAGSPASEITEVPAVNFESKSRANTLPPGNGAASSNRGVAVPKAGENEAKTQIIKNAKELAPKRLDERADVHVDEQDERAELSRKKTETDVANSGRGVEKEVFVVELEAIIGESVGESFLSQLTGQQKSETVTSRNPQGEQIGGWPTQAGNTNQQEAVIDKSGALFSRHIDDVETVAKSPTTEATAVLNTSELTGSTQATQDTMDTGRKLKNGIKLAEIVTDEYKVAADAVSTKPVNKEAKSEQAKRDGESTGKKATMEPTLKQQQDGKQLGQLVQQTGTLQLRQQQHTTLVKQKEQQQSKEEELEQHQPIQLRREQQANKNMENGQVQRHNAHTASEIYADSSDNRRNMNKKHTNNNKAKHSDHVGYTTPESTTVGSLPTLHSTPPALNIVDLYPMKMEDFNPIIRDSNAKLLKVRTIFKPAESDEGPPVVPAAGWYGHAKQMGEVEQLPMVDGEIEEQQQENLLPNEVDAANNIIQRYDNINNLAARHTVNRRPITTAKTAANTVGRVAAPISQQQDLSQPDAISDFTGKVLAEQDGVITEIEQKFRLNEFAATATADTVTTTTTTLVVTASTATPSDITTGMERQLANGKSTYSVNHKIQPPKNMKNKYPSNGNKNDGNAPQRLAQHDFIERRVKKSFDFPMHRAASASDTLTMPHVDFANTKFNTGSGATQALSETPVSGAEGGGGAMRAALGTHPEFSTTKFYNSKELYNEMMQHNRKRLKVKSKMVQSMPSAVTATATATPTDATTMLGTAAAKSSNTSAETAASRFALRQSAKLKTSKYAPVAEPSKPIMGEVNMNSQRRVNGEIVSESADKIDATVIASGEAQSSVKVKSAGKQTESTQGEAAEPLQNQEWIRKQQQSAPHNIQLQKQSATHVYPALTPAANDSTADFSKLGDDKPTKKYQKELQRAKLLLKSILLQTNDKGAGTSNANTTAAHTATTTSTANSQQSNLHAPPTVSDASAEQLSAFSGIAAGKVNLVATAKTFDIMSLRHKSNVVTPTSTASAAVGNIDSNDDGAMTKGRASAAQAKQVNFVGADIVHVKRAKPAPTRTTKAPATITINSRSTETAAVAATTTKLTSTVAPLDDRTTPSPLIYPYPQQHRQQATHLSQPHDTTAALSSTTSTTYPTSSTTTTTNLSKSPSKPIVRPRILSPLQEKINSLECELQNVPSDSHLWRGNETHELLLPIMTSENCPYGGTDCSPLLVSWEGEAEIQSGDILIVEINDALLNLNEHNNTHTSLAHNTQVYQVTRSGHEHCDVTEGILLDITPLFVDGRKLVTLYDKDLTEGVNLLIVVSELWGSQCVRLKVTTKTDNCGESAECSGKGVCYSNPAMEEYECQCCSGFAGPHCEEIDACTPSPCTNNGICVDLSQGHEGNSYQCLCPYGYTGKNCQYESDPCNSAECMNGGSCVGNSTHFRCDCTPGYAGPLCQHSLNECESSPCVHGICVDQEDGFRCFCQPGFAGELCNFEYNECESNPCQNDGECIDHIGNFECRCTKGYTGARCQIKVDFCANKPCPDGHRCIDHGNDFSCECPGGRNGLDCNQMPRTQCNENLCKHGGTCWTSGASFYCACRPGYTGNMCEDEFVVETVVSSSEFMVDDTSARNFNDKTFGSSVVLKSPIELHNAYFGAGVLAAAVFIVAVVVAICHCKVNQTYRKFSTRSSTFFPILGFGRRSKSQNKLNKHWLSGKGLGGGGGGVGTGGGSLRSSGSTTSLTRGHLPSAHTGGGHQSHQRQQQLQQQQLGGQMHERPFQRHLAMNLENDMYYTVDFSENSQHSPLIQ